MLRMCMLTLNSKDTAHVLEQASLVWAEEEKQDSALTTLPDRLPRLHNSGEVQHQPRSDR